MRNSPYPQRLDGPKGLADHQVRAEFVHPGNDLCMPRLRIEIIGTDNNPDIFPGKLLPEQTRDTAVPAAPHPMDV